MITLFYSPKTKEIFNWQNRLERMIIKYQLIEQEGFSEPQLLDGEKHIQGTAFIEAYLDDLEKFVKTWKEDWSDKYEF